MHRTLSVTAEAADAGQRLDRLLAAKLPALSRARLQALIEAGEVERDGVLIADGSSRVKPGQRFSIHLPEPRPATPSPEALPLDVAFEDEHLIVLNKPAGMVVHPAPGHAGGTLVNALLAHCEGSLSGIGGVMRPGIVHRLDKDVSGLLVVAKHDRAHVRLAAQFSVHRVERTYAAIAWGAPLQSAGEIDAPIGRDPRDRKRMAVVAGGKPARTRFRVVRSAGRLASSLRLNLATGRTHQIRVHLASIGLHIVGDPLYRPRRLPRVGDPARTIVNGMRRLALHACELGFEHPISGAKLAFTRPPPDLFTELFQALEAEQAAFTPR
jgi:23S rRNA pseudouridine1911/1915/1917 synthase